MTDPANPNVLRWAQLAANAAARDGVPAPVLLGLIDVESKGVPGLTSPTGAEGITQFEPATAKTYGVDVRLGHEASQVDGAARYLVDLGYHTNATLALAKYNAGPNNPAAGMGYAANVLARAAVYGLAKLPPAGTSLGSAPGLSVTVPLSPADVRHDWHQKVHVTGQGASLSGEHFKGHTAALAALVNRHAA